MDKTLLATLDMLTDEELTVMTQRATDLLQKRMENRKQTLVNQFFDAALAFAEVFPGQALGYVVVDDCYYDFSAADLFRTKEGAEAEVKNRY